MPCLPPPRALGRGGSPRKTGRRPLGPHGVPCRARCLRRSGGGTTADLSYAVLEQGDEATALPVIYGSGFEIRPCDAGGAAGTRHVVRVTVAASRGRRRVDGGGGANRGRLHVLLHPRYPTCGSLVVVRMAYVDGSIPL